MEKAKTWSDLSTDFLQQISPLKWKEDIKKTTSEKINSLSCDVQIYSESSNLSEKIYQNLWISIDDCILKNFENIDDISNILTWLYKHKPEQLKKDLETNMIPLSIFIRWNKRTIQQVRNFHNTVPHFYFSADELIFWDMIQEIPNFPLKEMGVFIQDWSKKVTSPEWRNIFFSQLYSVLIYISPTSISVNNWFSHIIAWWEKDYHTMDVKNFFLKAKTFELDFFLDKWHQWILITKEITNLDQDKIWKRVEKIINKHKNKKQQQNKKACTIKNPFIKLLRKERIKDLESLINQWWNLPTEMWGNFICPKWIFETGNPGIFSPDIEKNFLYSSWLNKEQKHIYIKLLSMMDLSWWKGDSFSLNRFFYDEREILNNWFIETIETIKKEKPEIKIYFSDFDMIFEMQNNPRLLKEFLETDTWEIKKKIQRILASKRKAYRFKDNIYLESIENIQILQDLELFKVYLILSLLHIDGVQNKIIENIHNDLIDESSEHGGIITLKYPYFKTLSPSIKMDDWSFFPPEDFIKYSSGMIGQFHLHAVWSLNKEMSYFSWPSRGDMNVSSYDRKTQIVITYLWKNIFNIDYINGRWTILDLWTYNWNK